MGPIEAWRDRVARANHDPDRKRQGDVSSLPVLSMRVTAALVQRLIHADAGAFSRLIASTSRSAATLAPSLRIGPPPEVACARVSRASASLGAAERDWAVGAGPSCAAPIPSSVTRPAQNG